MALAQAATAELADAGGATGRRAGAQRPAPGTETGLAAQLPPSGRNTAQVSAGAGSARGIVAGQLAPSSAAPDEAAAGTGATGRDGEPLSEAGETEARRPISDGQGPGASAEAASPVDGFAPTMPPRGDPPVPGAASLAPGWTGFSAAGQAPPTAAVEPHRAYPTVEGVSMGGVSLEVGLKSLAGVNRFDIRLAPEELGRIDVRLDIAEDGRVKAHLVVDRPETLAQLQRETGQLERALEQAGLKTGDGGLAFTLRDQTGGDAGTGRGAGGRDERGHGPGPTQDGARSRNDDATAPPSRRLNWSRASGIDLRI